MPTLSAIYLYPIKSLSGIAVEEAIVGEKGFRHDRRFMLVDPSGVFITQRTHHQMALIDVAFAGMPISTLRIWHRHRPADVLEVPLEPVVETRVPLPVSIWDSEHVAAVAVSEQADRWFSAVLGQPCRLVYMPDTSHRPVEPTYALPDDEGRLPAVSFADGYPYLLIGQASLDDLNHRLPAPIGMARFRPNLVVAGSLPYEEDSWRRFAINGLTFYGVKPCARCVLTTIDPATGQKGPEPLRTLTTYRRWNHKILFGQNLLPDRSIIGGSGMLRVGQAISIHERTEPWLAPPVAS